MSMTEVEQLKKALEILSAHVANIVETGACPGDEVTVETCYTYMDCSNCLKDWAIRKAKESG